MTRVLLAGARGLLGTSLVETAAQKGLCVYAISRQTVPDRKGGAGVWLATDLEHPIEGRFPQADIWIHAAPLWLLPRHLHSIGTLGVRRIIAFSSTSVFTKAKSRVRADRLVAARLRTAEEACRVVELQREIAITLFRPTMIYGYRRDRNVSAIAHFISRYKIFPIPRHALGLRQPVHVDDLVSAVWNTVDNAHTFGNTYNLSGGEILTYQDMVARIFRSSGCVPRLLRIPTTVYAAVARILSLVTGGAFLNVGAVDRMRSNFNFSHQQATREFGYKPAGFLQDPARDLNVAK